MSVESVVTQVMATRPAGGRFVLPGHDEDVERRYEDLLLKLRALPAGPTSVERVERTPWGITFDVVFEGAT